MGTVTDKIFEEMGGVPVAVPAGSPSVRLGMLGVPPIRAIRVLAEETYQALVAAADNADPEPDTGSQVAEQIGCTLWTQYKGDFNTLTDVQIAAEVSAEQEKMDEAESWLEAVASWTAAGKPRDTEDQP